ncbi:MAG: hypothetical protein F6J97_10065 [Leptolyngbya sp. SIO4C1]|nr:hypothetical protein [Leptolyngbya sp. SIO4C1]
MTLLMQSIDLPGTCDRIALEQGIWTPVPKFYRRQKRLCDRAITACRACLD